MKRSELREIIRETINEIKIDQNKLAELYTELKKFDGKVKVGKHKFEVEFSGPIIPDDPDLTRKLTTYSFAWVIDDDNITVYATPFWEDTNGIPIGFYYEGDAESGKILPFKLTGDAKKDAKTYFSKVKQYLSRVEKDSGYKKMLKSKEQIDQKYSEMS